MPGAVSLPPVIHTTLNYYLDPAHGGTDVFYPGTAGNYRRKHDGREVDITDIRSVPNASDEFHIDKQGFQLVSHSCSEKAYVDDARVKDVVYAETSELLKKTAGATAVVPFSHIIRRQTWESALDEGKHLKDNEPQKTMTTANFIHVDQSYDGARQVLRDNLSPEDADRLSKTRWGIINVWRPIAHAVRRSPLAVCDARTVPDADLHPVAAVLPTKGSGTYENVSAGGRFETWHLTANPAHRWYYASRLTPDEVLLIKIYDSKSDGRARRVPHTAFASEWDEGPARESIEVRCLVFWEGERADE